MTTGEMERIDRAIDRLSDKLAIRFDKIDKSLEGHGNRLTSIETVMGERCAAHTGRINALEKSDRSYGKTLAKHAVVIGLALTALGAIAAASMKLVFG